MSNLLTVGDKGGVIILQTDQASADSGAKIMAARGFSKWVFQLRGTFTGYSVTIYGTISAEAAEIYDQNVLAGIPDAKIIIGNDAWFGIPAPSTSAADAFVYVNPLTTTGQVLYSGIPLNAVRAIATGTTQTGIVRVLAFAAI